MHWSQSLGHWSSLLSGERADGQMQPHDGPGGHRKRALQGVPLARSTSIASTVTDGGDFGGEESAAFSSDEFYSTTTTPRLGPSAAPGLTAREKLMPAASAASAKRHSLVEVAA